MLMCADSATTRAWFVDDFVPELIEVVLETWEGFRLTCSAKLEPRITSLFSDALELAYEKAGKTWFLVPEMKRTDTKTGKEVSRHDIRFFHREISGQRLYFVFECKRVNVMNRRGKILPNNAGYRTGMLQFINGVYSAGHPCAGMIAYVMDGDVPSALEKIKKLVRKYRVSLRLILGSEYAPSSLMPKHLSNGETKHQRIDGRFVIYHLLLPLN